MKTYIAKNIDVIQINITSGVTEYEFPKNVAWSGKKIDKLAIYAPASTPMLSPIDGVTPVMPASLCDNLYLNLYNGKGGDIAHYMHAGNIVYDNNNPVWINDTLSLELSSIKFATAPLSNYAMLIYVYYDGRFVEDYEEPKRNTTIMFSVGAHSKMNFHDIINTTFHVDNEKVRGIHIWNAENTPVYITLRDYKLTYALNNISPQIARPQILKDASAQLSQVHPLYLDSVDIDFDYSYILNTTANSVSVTMQIDY